MALSYLHVIIPQGSEEQVKMEPKFQELLISLRNTVTGVRFSFEYFGYEQYTYFYVVVAERYKETIEGLIYSIFPDAEIKPTKDYTEIFDTNTQAIAGCSLKLKERDVYPIRTYDQFQEDSMSRLFSVNSKIASGERVWTQIIVEPHDDSAVYHAKRNIRFWIVRMKKFFSVRDRMRKDGLKGVNKRRFDLAAEKETTKPFKVSIRIAYAAKDEATAKRKLGAVVDSFYHFSDTDINGFSASRITTGASFIQSYAQRKHASSYILSAKEVATLYHLPNSDHVPHIVHVLARKSDPPQDLPRKE